MNLLDILIVLLVAAAVSRGLRHGFLQLAFSSAGFIAGLLLGSWVASLLIRQNGDPYKKLLLILLIELTAAFSLSLVGEIIGLKLSHKVHKVHVNRLNQGLGAVFEIVSVLLITWLIASGLSNVRAHNIGHEVRGSFIIKSLNKSLPPPPDVLARLEKVISPNGFPNTFIGLEPRHTTISPHNTVKDQVILNDEKSVVKVQGAGCGGVIEGSGFVVRRGYVVTNAHVIAGVPSPEVVDSEGTYKATPIYFDPNQDLAVLAVKNLPDAPLPLEGQDLASGDGTVILGFPGGGPLVASRAVVIDEIIARGQNIYNKGVVMRTIYELQGEIKPGNSGGPLIAPDGSVAGIIFAKSVSQNNVGYALVIGKIAPAISKAIEQKTPVSSGSCAQS